MHIIAHASTDPAQLLLVASHWQNVCAPHRAVPYNMHI